MARLFMDIPQSNHFDLKDLRTALPFSPQGRREKIPGKKARASLERKRFAKPLNQWEAIKKIEDRSSETAGPGMATIKDL